MKKIVCLLIISVICLSLIGCSGGPAPESWSNFAEYDGVNFDPNEYIDSVVESGGEAVSVPIWYVFEEEKTEGMYLVKHSDDSFMFLLILEDTDAAKTAHENYIKNYAFEKTYNPHALAIRINNTIVFGSSPEQSQCITALAKDIGIPEDQIELQRNNRFWLIARRDTDKSVKEMLRCIKDKGYTTLYEYNLKDTLNGYPVEAFVYTIASEDYSAVYDVFMFSGKYAKGFCYTTIYSVFESYPIIKNDCHIYYSLNDGCCMFIVGVSADTRSFWDEIR